MTRCIESLRIRFMSLVPKCKNRLPVYFSAADAIELKNRVINNGNGYLTVIVFTPRMGFLNGYIASPFLMRHTAHEYLRKGAKLDIRHAGKAIGRERAAVVESFIIQYGDPRFADIMDYEGRIIDATGEWAVVIRLFDGKLRELYRGPEAWGGVSIIGDAVFQNGHGYQDIGCLDYELQPL